MVAKAHCRQSQTKMELRCETYERLHRRRVATKFADHEGLAALGEQMADMMPPVEGAHIAPHSVPTQDGSKIEVRVITPDRQSGLLPLLVWSHGGGHVVGSAAQDDAFCAQVAATAHCVIVSVDYQLAPEFPSPTPLDDCYAGVPIDLHIYKGAYHSFDQFAAASGIAQRSNTDSLGALERALCR